MESRLAQCLPAPEFSPARLHEAMRYAVLGGGKRIRPLLTFAAGELTEAAPERLETAAAAVELVHAYSLIHDDLPCMDNDVLRRGKPTCHIEFGEAVALLAGDALQSLAFQLLAEYRLTDAPAAQLEMTHLLALAAGSRGMAGGQAIDLESVKQPLSLPELEAMHIRKTGALIRAAVLLGARCGKPLDPARSANLDQFAKWTGLAFQVVDDILDAQASTATLGKTAGKDAKDDKPTYVSIMGLNEAAAFAQQLHEKAVAALQAFGDDALRLAQIADQIVKRRY
jgi:farnesyl diphosphate synthase